MAVTLIYDLQAVDGKAEELAPLLLAGRDCGRSVEGCEAFEVYQDQDDPQRFVMMETWVALEAQQQHFETNVVPSGALERVGALVTAPIAPRYVIRIDAFPPGQRVVAVQRALLARAAHAPLNAALAQRTRQARPTSRRCDHVLACTARRTRRAGAPGMADSTFTFRVDDELKSAFAEVAVAQERTAAQLLRVLMRETVQRWHESQEHDGWFRGEIGDALGEAEDAAVQRVAHEHVVSTWRQQRAELERRAAGRTA
jgi:quinol monooxygenase YgiN/predicted transcriptional regulator